MNHKDDYFDGDTHDLLLYKIAQRDKVIEVCHEALAASKGIGSIAEHCRKSALAAIEQLGKEKS